MSSTIQGTVSSSGVGSGIDVQSLVAKLVAAEGQNKQQALATRQATVTAQVSAYGSFKSAAAQLQSAVAALKDPKAFQSLSAMVGDANVLAATASGNAVPGAYAIEVQRLATGAKLASAPYAQPSTTVGTGTLTLAAGTTSVAVTVDATNDTLAGLRDAINAKAAGTGIAATLVTANDGVRLVLTSSITGAANDLRVTQSGGDGGLAALAYDPANRATALTQLQAAQDARVKIDGYTYDSTSNTVTGAIDGLTLNLKGASAAGVTTPVTIAADPSATQKAIQAFVTAYDSTVAGLRQLGAYNAATQQGGVLLGDATLSGFLDSVRGLLGGALPGAGANGYSTLAQLGITSSLDGTLNVDAAKLGSALQQNPAGVAALFAGPGGLATRLDATLATYTQAGGVLDARSKGLQSTLTDLSDQQTRLQAYLDAYKARITAQFNAMDTMVAQLKSTGDALLQQLSTINPNYFGSSSK